MFLKKIINLEIILLALIRVFLFLLPWQTIWIYREGMLNGVKWEYGTSGFYVTEVLLWIVIVLFGVWYWKRYKFKVQSSKFNLTNDRIVVSCFLFLISYFYLSITWSIDRDLALQQALRVMEMGLLIFILFLGPVDFRSGAKWFVAGAILPSVLGVWQFLAQSTFASKWLGLSLHPAWGIGTSVISSEEIGRWLRAYGSFGHPNVMGGYLVIVLGVFLLLNWFNNDKFLISNVKPSSKFKYQSSNKVQTQNIKSNNLRSLIFVLIVFSALFFTFSRSAWLAVVVLFIVHCSLFIYFKIQFTFFHLLPAVLIISLSLIFWPLINTRVSASSPWEKQSTVERVSGYEEAWSLFKQNPILGVGVGNYTAALYQSNPNRPGWEYQPVHNVFMLFLVEMGGVGLLLVLLLLFSIINAKLLISNFKSSQNFKFQSSNHNFTILQLYKLYNSTSYFLFSIFIYLILSLFDHYFYSSYIGLMLSAVFFGLIIRHYRDNPQFVDS